MSAARMLATYTAATKRRRPLAAGGSLGVDPTPSRTRRRKGILRVLALLAGVCVCRLVWTSQRWNVQRWSLSTPSGFYLPMETAIVAEDLDDFIVDNFPSSHLRPQNQFLHSKRVLGPPVVVVGTVAKNLDERIMLTYKSLSQGSLSTWRWHIVDHGTSDPQSLKWLKTLSRQDPRIVVTRARASAAHASAMNQLLLEMGQEDAPYGVILPPYSMLEHTILEKSAWSLATVPKWHLVGHFTATFGATREIGVAGLHSGALNTKKNLVPDASMFRLATTAALNCTFDAQQVPALLMWDFWLCFARNGRWGGTIPELGAWSNSSAQVSMVPSWAVRRFGLRAGNMSASTFPLALVTKSTALEPVGWTPAITNVLVSQRKKGIMIVQGWLLVGGSELGLLEVLRYFTEQSIPVTMVLTRMNFPQSTALRERVAEFTNDIHTLPSFLRMSDFPRYLKYLMETRSISTVFMSNSQLIYEVLPALAEQTPGVAYIDYLHNEAFDGWKTDGFPSFSLISRRYLSRTLTCSEHLRDWLIQRGYPSQSVGVAKLGINTTKYSYTTEETRLSVKSKLLAMKPTTLVLVSSARIDSQKRPLLVPSIVEGVIARLAASPCANVHDVVMFMMGDGSLRESLLDVIAEKGLEKNIVLLGTVDDPTQVLRGGDIFLLPSAIEGISIAVAEAMAIGLPIVTTSAGALPEQLGDLGGGHAIGGRLVTPSVDESLDVQGYIDAVVELACDAPTRLAIGRAAHDFVVETFDQRSTLTSFMSELEFAPPAIPSERRIPDTPNPSAQYALQSMAMEDGHYVDLYSIQLQLSRVNRVGRAGRLESRCQLDGSWGQVWINAVAEGTLCSSSAAKGESWLYKSAAEQCGAWCIWDLRTTQAVGWRFNGRCFDEISDRTLHPCADWFASRPQITFVSGGVQRGRSIPPAA